MHEDYRDCTVLDFLKYTPRSIKQENGTLGLVVVVLELAKYPVVSCLHYSVSYFLPSICPYVCLSVSAVCLCVVIQLICQLGRLVTVRSV